ncbi:MAG: SH3 domain-containing protein [Ferruginibacter sp.]
MRNSFLFFFLLTSYQVFAQQNYYAAARAGLSIREQASTESKVVDKIPYGTKLELVKDSATSIMFSSEGFSGHWWKVKYNDKTGYVVNIYVLPAVPPKATAKTIEDYFKEISDPYGKPLELKENFVNTVDETTILTKQLYKNGMEHHHVDGYEYGADLYMLPGFTVEQAYLLVRLVKQFPAVISDNDPFPTKNNIIKKGETEKAIEVERENYGGGKPGPVKKIRLIHSDAIITEIEIFSIDQQVAIRVNAGV